MTTMIDRPAVELARIDAILADLAAEKREAMAQHAADGGKDDRLFHLAYGLWTDKVNIALDARFRVSPVKR